MRLLALLLTAACVAFGLAFLAKPPRVEELHATSVPEGIYQEAMVDLRQELARMNGRC